MVDLFSSSDTTFLYQYPSNHCYTQGLRGSPSRTRKSVIPNSIIRPDSPDPGPLTPIREHPTDNCSSSRALKVLVTMAAASTVSIPTLEVHVGFADRKNRECARNLAKGGFPLVRSYLYQRRVYT
jgi:hypothetical protein